MQRSNACLAAAIIGTFLIAGCGRAPHQEPKSDLATPGKPVTRLPAVKTFHGTVLTLQSLKIEKGGVVSWKLVESRPTPDPMGLSLSDNIDAAPAPLKCIDPGAWKSVGPQTAVLEPKVQVKPGSRYLTISQSVISHEGDAFKFPLLRAIQLPFTQTKRKVAVTVKELIVDPADSALRRTVRVKLEMPAEFKPYKLKLWDEHGHPLELASTSYNASPDGPTIVEAGGDVAAGKAPKAIRAELVAAREYTGWVTFENVPLEGK